MQNFGLQSSETPPELDIDDVDLAHSSPYRFAANYLKDKQCRFGLDVFCGSGYGTFHLAEKLSTPVLGIDASAQAIEVASRNMGLPNLFFSQKTFPYSLPLNWADFIVAFDSLSYTAHSEALAKSLAGSLTAKGILFLSAPNEDYFPANRMTNSSHPRRFRAREVADMFTSQGLVAKQTLSSNRRIVNGERVICGNAYSPTETAYKPDTTGESIMYIFEKAEA